MQAAHQRLTIVLVTILAASLVSGAAAVGTEATGASRSVTLVLMTDTHLDMKCSAEDLSYIAQWIVDNAQDLNIGYVGHLGDVGDLRGSDSLFEMLRQARAALQPLADNRIPVSVAIGNHDYRDGGEHPRSAEAFNQSDTFGEAFYELCQGFMGTFEQETDASIPHPGGTANHYLVLRLAGEDFLFLTLEYYPRDAVMDWADSLVRERYPDHHVILSTHAFLTREGQLSTSNYGDADAGPLYSNSGADMWHRFLRHWKNLRLVFNGHFIDEPRQQYLAQAGAHGNTVHSHFFNYQNWAYRDGELYNTRSGGRFQASVLRLLTLRFDENSVRVRNFLPQVNVDVEPAAPEAHPFIVSAP